MKKGTFYAKKCKCCKGTGKHSINKKCLMVDDLTCAKCSGTGLEEVKRSSK